MFEYHPVSPRFQDSEPHECSLIFHITADVLRMGTSRDRRQIVDDLVHLRKSPEQLLAELKVFPWDSEELVVMTAADAVEVLGRGLNGTVSLTQIAEWADAIEMRDDVGLSPDAEELLRDMIFELATPELEGPLTVSRLHEWISTLSTRA